MKIGIATTHVLNDRTGRRLLVASVIVVAVIGTLTGSAMASGAAACEVHNQSAAIVYATLQSAVDEAAPGDQLTVLGICRGETVIDKDLTIEGAPSGSLGNPVLDGKGKGRLVTVEQSAAVTLRALVVRNGRASRGGGLRNSGDLALDDVRVRNNSADYGGGAWNEVDATMKLMGTTSISGNHADGYGGGVMNLGTLSLSDSSSISKNSVGTRREWAEFRGGGVFNDGTLSLQDVATISGNRAREGGGVANVGTLALGGTSSIADNRARQSAGGVWNGDEAMLTLDDSATISGNDGGYMGGGVENHGTVTLNGASSIRDNVATTVYGTGTTCGPSAGELGGGVDNRGALIMNDTSTIGGNQSRFGGGVMNRGLLRLADSSTIEDNSAKSLGGGVYNEHGQATLWLAYDPGPPVPYQSCPMGTLVMTDTSTISSNSSRRAGGGVHGDPSMMEGVVCGPEAGANVTGNEPDDCTAPSSG